MKLRNLFSSISLLVLINLILKPVWIFLIDRNVQLIVGQEAYGEYYFLLQFSIICSVLLDAGISTYFTANFTLHNKDIQYRHFNSLIKFKMMLSIFYTVVVMVLSMVIGIKNTALLIQLVLFQVINFLLLFARSYFSTNQWFQKDILLSVADKLFAIVMLGWLLHYNKEAVTIKNFLTIQILCSATLLLICLVWIAGKNKGNPFTASSIEKFWKPALPYALLIFVMAVLLRGDTILLRLLHQNGNTEVGRYAYGYRITDAFNSFGFLWAGFLFPFICNHIRDKKIISSAAQTSILVLWCISLSAILVVLIFSKSIVQLLYHIQEYSVEKILLYCTGSFPGISLVLVYGTVLTAYRKIKTLVIVTTAFAVSGIVLDCIFLPANGAIAAALINSMLQFGYGLTLLVICYKQQLILFTPLRLKQVYNSEQ